MRYAYTKASKFHNSFLHTSCHHFLSRDALLWSVRHIQYTSSVSCTHLTVAKLTCHYFLSSTLLPKKTQKELYTRKVTLNRLEKDTQTTELAFA